MKKVIIYNETDLEMVDLFDYVRHMVRNDKPVETKIAFGNGYIGKYHNSGESHVFTFSIATKHKKGQRTGLKRRLFYD